MIWTGGYGRFGGFLASFLGFLGGLSRMGISSTGFKSGFFSLTSFLLERITELTLAESYTSLALKVSKLTRLVLDKVLMQLFEGMEV